MFYLISMKDVIVDFSVKKLTVHFFMIYFKFITGHYVNFLLLKKVFTVIQFFIENKPTMVNISLNLTRWFFRFYEQSFDSAIALKSFFKPFVHKLRVSEEAICGAAIWETPCIISNRKAMCLWYRGGKSGQARRSPLNTAPNRMSSRAFCPWAHTEEAMIEN